MSSDKKSKINLAETLAHHSVLEDLPSGDKVTELRSKIGDENFLKIVDDLWSIMLDTLYFNVSEDVRFELNKLIESQQYQELTHYLLERIVEEPMYLDLLGSGLDLAVKVVIKENNF